MKKSMRNRILLAGAALLSWGVLMTPAAYAGCGLSKGEVNVLSNVLPQFDIFEADLKKCEGDGFSFTWKKTAEHKTEQVTAFAASTSPYDAALVANSSITTVQSRGLLRPLDDLVAKYKDKYNIEDGMIVRIDGKIYAVAFMANAQHFVYRKDLFEKHGLSVPKTYDDVLKAAAVLKEDSSIEYPYGAAYKAGWNLAQEFNNIYLSMGGKFFQPGSAKPSFNSTKAIEALHLMRKLYRYMSPNSLVIDSGVLQQQMRDGKVGMALLWGNRIPGVDDPSVSKVVGKIGLAAAPASVAGGPAAATVFWDGFVIPKNSDGNDDLTFRTMMHVYRPEIVEANNDATIWLRSVYKPSKYANGVVATVQAGAPPFSMNPAYTYAHGALGKHIGAYLAGEKSVQEVLRLAEKDYITVAKENGLL